MTTISRPSSGAVARGQSVREALARVLGGSDSLAWARPALLAVSALAAVLYLWDLTISGYANEYYAMAAQAASQSWSAWFFGSLDAGNFITLDKPPLATMLIGLSVRLLGLSSLSILLPQAILGVATVGLLFVVVRRSFGPVAATIAGVVMALTPAAVLIFRYDNPDALLTFLLVAAAGTFLASIESGHRRWLLATGLLVGAAFLTKYLQAYLVLPGFALAYIVAARGSVGRRIVDLVALGVVTVVASGWWVAIVELVPAASRPYIGGSTGNSVLDLVFGYDGLDRIFGMFGFGPPGGGAAVPAGPAAGGGGFGGEPGLLRMFNAQFAGQISWFLPFSVAGLVTGLWARRRAGRGDSRVAAYLVWGGWLVVTVGVFSFMSGIIHSYYTVALAPAIAALVGAGTVELWRLRERSPLGGLPFAAVILASAAWAAILLATTPEFVPGLGIAIVGLAVAASLVLLLPAISVGRSLSMAFATVGLVALLAAPTAYAAVTMGSVLGGGDPSAGPSSARNSGFGGAGGGRALPAGIGGLNPPGVLDGAAGGPAGVAGGSGGVPGGLPGLGGGVSQALIDYLVANRGGATWLVAVSSANEAAPIQLATGMPVMATGGFTGSDVALSLDQLRAYVSSGQLRFILAGGMGGPIVGAGGAGRPGGGSASTVDTWVASACTAVTSVSSQLFDCSAASSAGG